MNQRRQNQVDVKVSIVTQNEMTKISGIRLQNTMDLGRQCTYLIASQPYKALLCSLGRPREHFLYQTLNKSDIFKNRHDFYAV